MGPSSLQSNILNAWELLLVLTKTVRFSLAMPSVAKMVQYLENENRNLVSVFVGTTLGNRHTQRETWPSAALSTTSTASMWIGFIFRLECFVGLGQRAHFVRLEKCHLERTGVTNFSNTVMHHIAAICCINSLLL